MWHLLEKLLGLKNNKSPKYWKVRYESPKEEVTTYDSYPKDRPPKDTKDGKT